jgi:hypothetical protein
MMIRPELGRESHKDGVVDTVKYFGDKAMRRACEGCGQK